MNQFRLNRAVTDLVSDFQVDAVQAVEIGLALERLDTVFGRRVALYRAVLLPDLIDAGVWLKAHGYEDNPQQSRAMPLATAS